jgi:histidinol phosphatase-like PHP family hydrolase
MQVDFDRIVEAAIAHGVALEINGKPYRMDLPVRRIRHAAQAGAQFVLSADAHSVRDHDQLLNAVQQGRRAGLAAGQILNTRPLAALTGWLTSRSAGVLTDL